MHSTGGQQLKGRTCMMMPVSAFHIQAEKSSEPASSTLPLGCHCSQSMASPGPSRVPVRLPVLLSHIFTRPAARRLSWGTLQTAYSADTAMLEQPKQ